MQKSSTLLMSLFLAAAAFYTQPVMAKESASCDLQSDRCSGKPLSPSQTDKSLFLGDHLNAELEKLYQKNKALGKDTKVVLVARMGQNMEKFKILEDKNGQESITDVINRLLADKKQSGSAMDLTQSANIDYQDLLRSVNEYDQMKYSHLGIAFRNMKLISSQDNETVLTGGDTGKWAFYHLLYSCEVPKELQGQGETIKRSHIFKGTVHSFFYDHLEGYGAQIVVPTQQIQDNLEDMLLNKRQAYNFQQDQYNAAAKFDDLNQQNSNQFVLEAVAAASQPNGAVMSRAQAIDVLKKTKFSSSKIAPTGFYAGIRVPLVQNILSSIMPTMCLENQRELRKYGVGEIVTSNSVVNWMTRNEFVDEVIETGLPKSKLKEIESWNVEQDKEFQKQLDEKEKKNAQKK